MSTAVQLRRGTTTQHSTFTGVVGEVTVDTTKDVVVVHDGTTVGGHPVAREDHLHAGIYEPADATILKEADLGTIIVQQTSATGSADIPTGTTAQRDATPQTGYFRFNTTLNKYEGYNGTSWGSVGGGATGGGSDDVFVENGQTVTTNYTITSNKNAISAGPITVNTGVTVTIPSGSTWTVV